MKAIQILAIMLMLFSGSLMAQQKSAESQQIGSDGLPVDTKLSQAQLDQLAECGQPNPAKVEVVLEPDPRDVTMKIPEGANMNAPNDAKPIAPDETDKLHADPTILPDFPVKQNDLAGSQMNHDQDSPVKSGQATLYPTGSSNIQDPAPEPKIKGTGYKKGPATQPPGNPPQGSNQ